MNILVFNCGSSSLKYRLVGLSSGDLARGAIDRLRPGDHPAAIAQALAVLREGHSPALERIAAVGHRVVHGGERFTGPVLVDGQVLEAIRACIPLAPLHNPANLAGIEAAMSLLPGVPQVAVFDTAFHASLAPHAYLYALPKRLYERHGIRRYGFHGTSHAYVAGRCAELLGQPLSRLKLVTCHLGNGASVTAVAGGASLDTSMGFTPLEGLIMGTRSGDVDAGAVLRVMEREALDPAGMAALLNADGGLLGLCGYSDMRDVEAGAERGDADCLVAFTAYCHRLRKYIGAYAAAMDGLDGLVFTAGVGENSPAVRATTCAGLAWFGVAIDPAANAARGEERELTAPGARVRTFVIPTDEELAIAKAAARLASALRP